MDRCGNDIVRDEIVCAADLVKRAKRSALGRKKAYFITNHCPFGDFTFLAFDEAKKKGTGVFYVVDEEEKKDHEGLLPPFGCVEKNRIFPDIFDENTKVRNSIFYFFVDCRDPLYRDEQERSKVLLRLEKWLSITRNTKVCNLFLITQIRTPESLPAGIRSISEREYDYYLAHKERDWSEKFYLELEDCCRSAARGGKKAKVSILRFDNVFGPGVDLMDRFSMKDLIDTAFRLEKVEVTHEDAEEYISSIYIRDAVQAVAVGARSARVFNVYNVSGYLLSIKQIKVALQSEFRELLALSIDVGKAEQERYHSLNSLKLSKFGFKATVRFAEAIYRTGIYYRDLAYDMNRQLGIYSGRLEMIKSMERDMLKFVDKVCRENGIQYFLAGGSLLGAVRHNGIIPWDDDLDIGMLRKDFEKFRRICPGLVPEKYTYESPQDGRGSHYCFDKLRFRNTYFSTNYSNNFRIQDGIFLDVIVYDQTSNFKFMTKLQIQLIRIWTRLINIKWYNKPRKNVHYRFTKVFLPVMRMIPFPFFHAVFERLVRWYEKKPKAKYLIDGLGQNIGKGRFPKSWLTEVAYVKFDDMEAPVPIDYDGYLRHFYGPQYMELLPISKRVSGHHIARIDLGGYLYGDGSFRDVDIKGELLEKSLREWEDAALAEMETAITDEDGKTLSKNRTDDETEWKEDETAEEDVEVPGLAEEDDSGE